jgi:hypothetical protein
MHFDQEVENSRATLFLSLRDKKKRPGFEAGNGKGG